MKSRFHHKWRNLEAAHPLERGKLELVRLIASMMEIVQRISNVATMDVHMCVKIQVNYNGYADSLFTLSPCNMPRTYGIYLTPQWQHLYSSNYYPL